MQHQFMNLCVMSEKSSRQPTWFFFVVFYTILFSFLFQHLGIHIYFYFSFIILLPNTMFLDEEKTNKIIT